MHFIRRQREDVELEEEIEFHRAMRQREMEARGVDPRDAARAARRALGSIALAKEQARDVWIPRPMQGLSNDLRFGARLLARHGGCTAAAVGLLALGLGIITAAFTFVYGEAIRDLPFRAAERLVSFGTRDARGRDLRVVSYQDVEDWRQSTTSFADLAMFTAGTIAISSDGRAAERFNGFYVSANTFRILGVAPAVGRDFTADDDRPSASPVVILGYHMWSSRYARDAAVVGRSVKVNEQIATVVGVMPEGMRFPARADAWLPLTQLPGLQRNSRNARTVAAFGRLANGTLLKQARVELASVAMNLAREHPDTNKDVAPTLITLHDRFTGDATRLLCQVLLAAAACVLLVACFNVASLLLARSLERSREIGMRVALGASRWRIVRQLLVESALLAALGSAAGFIVSLAGIRWIRATFDPLPNPFWVRFTLDRPVYLFFAGACLSTLFLFGLVPAVQVSRADAALRARRWNSVLVVVNLAVTLAVLAGAGLLMRSFVALFRMDFGIDTSHALTAQIALPSAKYPTGERRLAFTHMLEDHLDARQIGPSAVASQPPFWGGLRRELGIAGRSAPSGERAPVVTMLSVSPRYFAVLGLPLVRGRAFTEADGTPGNAAAIVNERFASLHLAGVDPIGQWIRLTMESVQAGTISMASPEWMTIVGVAPNVRQRNFTELEPDPVVYVPYRTAPVPSFFVFVRAPDNLSAVTASVRDATHEVDPDLPLFDVQTVEERLSSVRGNFRIAGTMFGVFAWAALLLSAVGLYAVTAYAVSRRTREIGIRMALGATPRGVWWLIGRSVCGPIAIGLVLGMAGAFGIGRLLGNLVAQISPTDPLTLTMVAALTALVSLAAALAPARRATRVDPATVLRCDG